MRNVCEQKVLWSAVFKVLLEKSLFNTQQSNNCKQLLCTVVQMLSVSGTCVENLEHQNTIHVSSHMSAMHDITVTSVHTSVHALEACGTMYLVHRVCVSVCKLWI